MCGKMFIAASKAWKHLFIYALSYLIIIPMFRKLNIITEYFCFPTVCQEIPIYENTIVQQDTGHILESTITFACAPGYLLRGNPTIRCTHTGFWSKREFTCEGMFAKVIELKLREESYFLTFLLSNQVHCHINRGEAII